MRVPSVPPTDTAYVPGRAQSIASLAKAIDQMALEIDISVLEDLVIRLKDSKKGFSEAVKALDDQKKKLEELNGSDEPTEGVIKEGVIKDTKKTIQSIANALTVHTINVLYAVRELHDFPASAGRSLEETLQTVDEMNRSVE